MSTLRVLLSGLGMLAVASAWVLLTQLPAIAEEAPGHQAGEPQAVSCDGLTAPAWKDHEVETMIDMENGLLTVVYYDAGDTAVTLTVRYEDRACSDNPTLRELIRHVVSTANEDIATECSALKERLAIRDFKARGRSLDPRAMVAYIERWC